MPTDTTCTRTPTMHRRGHRESRNGCVECKRRHIKCEETHPTCIKCSTAQLRCMYVPGRKFGAPHSSALPRATSRDGSSLDPSAALLPPSIIHPRLQEPAASNAKFPVVGTAEDHLKVNILHIQLLHHFTTEAANTLFLDIQEAQISQAVTMKAALSAPYLMQEILALSALHLSVLHPAQQEFYHHQASGLQTRALTIFNDSQLDIDDENCIPIALFSSLLAMHSLCDVVNGPNSDYSNFLNSFIHCLDLHRGIRAITSHSWSLTTIGNSGRWCSGSADLGPASMKAYETAIEHLQRKSDLERISNGRDSTFASRPVLVPIDYVDLVLKRSPEAMVILAHYAVVLHAHRADWFIGDGGKYLIDSISRHLGSYWDKWMAWPSSVLLGSSGLQHLPRRLSTSPAAVG